MLQIFKKRFIQYAGLFLIFLLIAMSSSCGGSKPSNFYMLSAMANADNVDQSTLKNELTLGIGPIKFPDYLMRPQIATHLSPNRLNYAEFDRWAEPLDENFKRVLTENISRIVPTDKIVHFPWRASSIVKYQVTMEVLQFVVGADNTVQLKARWAIFKNSTDGSMQLKVSRKSELSQPGPQAIDGKPNYDAIASIMSKLAEELSQDIATRLNSVAN